MNSKLKIALICTLLAALQGCASQIRTPIPKDSLRSAASSYRPLILDADFSYWTSSVAKSGGTVILLSGSYTPTLENESGVFYKGPPGCVVFKGPSRFGDEEHFSQDGGIWLPKDPNQSPRSFAFGGSLKTLKLANTQTTATAAAPVEVAVPSAALTAGVGPAGVGVGLGAAIVGVLVANEQDPRQLHFAFDPIGDGSKVRDRFRVQ